MSFSAFKRRNKPGGEFHRGGGSRRRSSSSSSESFLTNPTFWIVIGFIAVVFFPNFVSGLITVALILLAIVAVVAVVCALVWLFTKDKKNTS